MSEQNANQAWNGACGKRILITGATNGIGLAAAKALARLGANLALVARNPAKAAQAVHDIRSVAGWETVVDVFDADLSSQQSVRQLAFEVLQRYPRLDVLVNNAGAMFAKRQITPEGFEMTWAVNHLAPFLLTNLLLERLLASAPARIITTSSDAHRGKQIPFDDLGAERFYRPFTRYGVTKLANILFTRELARRLDGTGVTANCFHPGVVATGFNHNNGKIMNLLMVLLKPFSRTPQKGAETLVWLVNSPDIANQTGGYFVDKRLSRPTAAAQDMLSARRLWEISEQQTGGQVVRKAA